MNPRIAALTCLMVISTTMLGATLTGCTLGIDASNTAALEKEAEFKAALDAAVQAMSDAKSEVEYWKERIESGDLGEMTMAQMLENMQAAVAKLTLAGEQANLMRQKLAELYKTEGVPWWTGVLSGIQAVLAILGLWGGPVSVLRGLALKQTIKGVEKADVVAAASTNVKESIASESGKGLLGWLTSRLLGSWVAKYT